MSRKEQSRARRERKLSNVINYLKEKLKARYEHKEHAEIKSAYRRYSHLLLYHGPAFAQLGKGKTEQNSFIKRRELRDVSQGSQYQRPQPRSHNKYADNPTPHGFFMEVWRKFTFIKLYTRQKFSF